jgi:prepilin peptidase CpaA
VLPISDALTLLTLITGVVAAAVIDLRTRRVPNALTGGLAAVALALAAAGLGRVGLAAAFAGGLLGLVFMLPGHLLGATGAGDVKLFAAAGLMLGPEGVVTAFFATAIVGGLLAVGVASQRGRLAETCAATTRLVATAGGNAGEIEHPDTDNRFAYAPAIAFGVMLAALAG